MIREVLSEHAWLWPLVWQSTLCLAAGLGGSVILWKRPARAHQALVIGLIAAAVIPAMSHVVKQRQWGLFLAHSPAATPRQAEPMRYETPRPPELPAMAAPEYAVSPRQADVGLTPPSRKLHSVQWLFPAWLLIGGILLVRLVARFLLSLRMVKTSRPAVSGHLAQTLTTARTRLGLQGDITIRSGQRVLSPMIWCWSARPILLVPSDAGHNGGHLDWTSILCHELAHWKRRDHVTGLFAELMLCALPWQALLWWAPRRLARLSEEACDDWVVACGRSGVDYAETLLDLTPQGRLAFAPSVVSSKKPLAQRIHRILQDHCASPHPGLRWTLAAITLSTCTILTIAFAQTRPAKQDPKGENAISNTQVATPGNQETAESDSIMLRLVDPNGRPVAGAKVAQFVYTHEFDTDRETGWLPRTPSSSDENGQVVLNAQDYFLWPDRVPLYILHEERGIGAIHEIIKGDRGEGLPIVLKPVCRVRGVLDSTGLTVLGMPLRSINVDVRATDMSPQVLDHGSNRPTHDFDFLLPPGTYTLHASGSGSKEGDSAFISAHTEFKNLPITVPEGESTLDLGLIDLHPTKWASLIGHPAPEIGPMKAWKNGSPVSLADLRGQFVWLRFGGGGTAVYPELHQLVELHEAFGNRGLTIIMISNWSSLEEFDLRRTQAPDQLSAGVREVPFRIAIDGDATADREETSTRRIGATFESYGIVSYPTDILIDPAGNIVGHPNLHRAKEAISQMLGAPQERADQRATRTPLIAGQARTLRFPQDRSLGTLYVRDVGRGDWYEDWEEAGQAQGNRFVAGGKQVKLEANAEAAADLSPLEKLGPDDLQMLGFAWEPVMIGSLAPLAKLTGLRALNLQSARFDPNEFRHLTGLRQLEVLRLGDYKLTDASMQYLGKLTSLKSLALWGTGISDEGLQHLEGLTNLTFLALNNCTITDEGLRYLHGMTALEGLQLSQTKITDAGLVHLQHLSGLKHVKLDYTKITDAGLKRLETLSQLDNIWLDTTSISDAGLPSLAKLRNLKEVYLSRTRITSAGLRHLVGLPELQHIILDGIGDEGVRHLSELPAMSQLQLVDTTVTPASAEYLKAMPSLKELLLSGDTVDDALLDTLQGALPECKVWDPQRSREYPMPDWRRKFEAVYRLEEGEILKRIVPPFIPERMDFYKAEDEHQAELIPDGPDSMTFHWDHKLKNWGMSFGSRVATLNRVLNNVLRLKSYEYSGTKELLDIDLPGDWIIRDEASQEAKLQALAAIMERELGWKIRFQRRSMIGQVIVATGKFTFHPPVGTYENKSVHLWVGESDTNAGAGGGTADSVGQFLQVLGDRANLPVIDQTKTDGETRIPYRHHRSSRLDRIEDDRERFTKLQELLANLTAQTELQFEIRTQPVEVWQITADNYN